MNWLVFVMEEENWSRHCLWSGLEKKKCGCLQCHCMHLASSLAEETYEFRIKLSHCEEIKSLLFILSGLESAVCSYLSLSMRVYLEY